MRRYSKPRRWLASLALAALLTFAGALGLVAADGASEAERMRVMVEALSRLNREQIEATPKLKEALDRALKATLGTADFVRLVRALELSGHTKELFDVAKSEAPPDVVVEALRWIFATAGEAEVRNRLSSENGVGLQRLVEGMGNSLDRRAVPHLGEVLKHRDREEASRRSAIHALARTQDGATLLLDLARGGALPEDLRRLTAIELGNVRWSAIKSEAAKVFPPAATRDAGRLPPVSELLKRTGDAVNGAAVFRRDTEGCIKCHQVRGEGVDFGPRLSEIGSKLAKDAIYAAILEPSAGISLGFEAWLMGLKNGDEIYGLLVGETDDEIVMKAQGGVVTRHKKAEVASRERQKSSIMPEGLAAAMTIQELVDLVEYLSGLRTADKP